MTTNQTDPSLSQRTKPIRSADDPEAGMALLLGILFAIIVTGITVSGALSLRANQQRTKTNFILHGQAVQFARSGLTEALGWYRKQTAQPVLAFDPLLDNAAIPPILETEEQDVGVVRQFAITGAVWGRYEIWKRWDADPDPIRLAWRQQFQAEDVSDLRNESSAGAVWKVRSVGYVFRNVDPSVPFNQSPNQVLGQEVVETEFRRLALQPPGQAALCVRDGLNSIMGNKARIRGVGAGTAGIYFPAISAGGTGSPTQNGGSEVTGSPATAAADPYDDSIEAIFGVSLEILRTMADSTISNPVDFPNPIPAGTIIVYEGPDITFDNLNPLVGTGIVYIAGSVNILAGSNSNFSGLLVIGGNLQMAQPSSLSGSTVVQGSANIYGNTDFTEVTYDDSILQALRRQVGQYRQSNAIDRPLAGDG